MGDHLLDEGVEHREGLAGTGGADNERSTERIPDGDVTVVPVLLIVVPSGQDDGPVVGMRLLFLLEGFLQVVAVLVESGEDPAYHGESPHEPRSPDERCSEVKERIAKRDAVKGKAEEPDPDKESRVDLLPLSGAYHRA